MILGYEEHFVNGLLVKRCGNSDNECYLGQDPLLTPGLLGSSSIGKSLKEKHCQRRPGVECFNW